MKDPEGTLADYIAMATLCRRLAVALQRLSPERLDEVLSRAAMEAEHALVAKVSLREDETVLLRNAARAELTFVKAIYGWVRPPYPQRAGSKTRGKVAQSA